MNPSPRGASRLWWIAVALPPIAVAALVSRYAVNVPFWDEWALASLFEQVSQGGWPWRALFAQHNEHRILVPRLIHLAIASVWGWDTRIATWLTQALLLAMLLIIVVLWRRSIGCRRSWAWISLVLASALLYLPAQHQNLLWGFQICFSLPVTAVLACAFLTSAATTSLGVALAATALLCTIASFSALAGLLAWPIVGAGLLSAYGWPGRHDRWKWAAWLAALGILLAAYFTDFTLVDPELLPAARQPTLVDLVIAVTAGIGGPFKIVSHPLLTSSVVGTAAIVGFCLLLFCVWRRRTDARLVAAARPWIVMGTYGLVVGAAIAVGRVRFGDLAVLESRYVTFVVWPYIAIVMLAAVLRDREERRAGQRRMFVREWQAIVSALVVLYAASQPPQVEALRASYRERLQWRAVVLFGDLTPPGPPVYPTNPSWRPTRAMLASLEAEGWLPPAPEAPQWMDRDRGGRRAAGDAAGDASQAVANCDVGVVEAFTIESGALSASGWSYLPDRQRPADAVLATAGTPPRIIALATPSRARPDRADRSRSGAVMTGWSIEAHPGSSDAPLEFWALDVEALRAYRLCRTS